MARIISHNAIDTLLWNWFRNTRNNGVRITSEMMRKKSQEIAKSLGYLEFDATTSWLETFKINHRISLIVVVPLMVRPLCVLLHVLFLSPAF